ncbi:MAG: C_GCAxxG_C_C family protein [Lachnospiraceae bacterium]|nr:C_GCAxxG_C_C family protein [Lachnospiraceae bacterium]
MLKDHIKTYYFDQNYNCAETIIHAGNDYYELGLHDRDMKMLGAYGAGMQCGNTCGAILAGASILSMKYIEAKAHESDDIRPVTQAMIKAFKEKYGSTLCRDIKPQSFRPEYRCLKTVETACDIIEQVIEDYEKRAK